MVPPLLSIIIPVLSEGATINTALDRLGSLQVTGGLEVVVADGNRRGTTLKAIQPDRHKNMRLKTTTAPTGRGSQMNRGAVVASGEMLVFLHADTVLPQQGLDQLIATLHLKPEIVGGAFDLGIRSSRKVYRLIEWMANRRSRFTRLPYGDQALFLRRDYFFSINGFADIPLMEDVEIMQRIKKKSDPIAILPIQVRTSPRRWEKEGVVFVTLRNWLLISLYYLGVSPERLARFYRF